jgi:hypothetical protein
MTTLSNAPGHKIEGRFNHRSQAIALIVGMAILAFLASPNGPLGGFWAPSPDFPAPTPGQIPLFILLNIFEAVTFGLGVSFLFFGLPLVRAIPVASLSLTRLAHLSISWLLLNWWPHDSLHVFNGHNMAGLLAIEYGFHVTLMLAGAVLAVFFLKALRGVENGTVIKQP